MLNINRILDKVKITQTGCWEWQKSKSSSGYGQLTVLKRYWSAHRYAYACFKPLKDTDVVRHICHNQICCNPEHLCVGTAKDNYYDSLEKHQNAAKLRRGRWTVEGVTYPTIREAVRHTGLAIETLLKYTDNGVFNTDGYRAGCKLAGWKPKV